MKKNIFLIVKLVLFMAVMTFVGYQVGYYIGSVSKTTDLNELYGELGQLLSGWTIYILVAIGLAYIVATIVAVKNRLAIKNTDEDGYERLEKRLELASIINEVAMICTLACFGIMIATENVVNIHLLSIVLLLCYVVNAVLVSRAIRKINPEKQTSVLELDYHKKYMQTMDEAEREQIGRAAMRSFFGIRTALLIFWVLTIILSMVIDIGVYPIIMVSIIWFVHYLSFVTVGNKKERR